MMNHTPIKDFYDHLAEFYDQMTDLDTRISRWEPVFRNFLNRYPATQVLDIGCGTGIHLLVLEKLGVKTVGIDLSLEMLKKANRHLQKKQISGKLIRANMANLPLKGYPSFDLILCTGNTLPHITDINALRSILNDWHMLLKPGGVVAIQLLNYHRILSEKKRLIHARHSESGSILRFYDFHDELIGFNVVKIPSQGDVEWNHIFLKPYTHTELQKILSETGFRNISLYSSMELTPFEENVSQDVVMIAGS